MSQALGKCDVALTQCRRDLLDSGTLLLEELTQELQIQFLIPGDTRETIFCIQAINARQIASARRSGPFSRCLSIRLNRLRGLRLIKTSHGVEKQSGINRLRNMIVHPGCETALALFNSCMSRH